VPGVQRQVRGVICPGKGRKVKEAEKCELCERPLCEHGRKLWREYLYASDEELAEEYTQRFKALREERAKRAALKAELVKRRERERQRAAKEAERERYEREHRRGSGALRSILGDSIG
jgi:hypothetical protein